MQVKVEDKKSKHNTYFNRISYIIYLLWRYKR